MQRAPLPLIFIAIGYLGLEALTLIAHPNTTVAIRALLSAILFYFVLRGSRVAGYVLAACSLGGALVCVYAVLKFLAPLSIYFGLAGLLSMAISAYICFSPTVRRFQRGPTQV